MKNAMQLKAAIKKIAKEKKISAALVMQNYMLERILERVSVSEYRDKFIIKGGFLIASMVGLDSRATMDMDATIKRYPLSEETIRTMVEEILNIDLDDGVSFSIKYIREIRVGDVYPGYRVALIAKYSPIEVPLKLDITAGDIVTPHEIDYEYLLMLENRRINVLAYNLATILAEKLETIISRGDQNTRPRDYYDIFILTKLQAGNVEPGTLALALEETARKRGSEAVVRQFREIMEVVRNSKAMNSQWNDYRKDFYYAADIEFSTTCDAVVELFCENRNAYTLGSRLAIYNTM